MVYWRLIFSMHGKDLCDFISNCNALKNFCDGVFSIDTMPKSLKRRHFFFSNLDVNSSSGSHWICILRNDKNQIELFDSLGVSEIKLEWFLKHNNLKKLNKLLYNTTPVQSLYSNSCGKFVLYFIIKRLMNIDINFETLLNNIFSQNEDENEIVVSGFLNDLLTN